jgi:hypothetical protein
MAAGKILANRLLIPIKTGSISWVAILPKLEYGSIHAKNLAPKIASTANERIHITTLRAVWGLEYLNLFPFFDLNHDATFDTPSCIMPRGQNNEQYTLPKRRVRISKKTNINAPPLRKDTRAGIN